MLRSNTLYVDALRAAPLDAAASSLTSYGAFKLRVPHPEAALHENIREAHRRVTRSGNADYTATMRSEVARLLESRPIFWSRVWPAGVALARFLLEEPKLVRGRTVLELGCGLGPGAVAAAIAGASDVVATDIEPAAVEFTVQSARDNGHALRGAAWNWNDAPPRALRAPFDVVLAGDVIYSEQHAPRLGRLLTDGSLLKPGGCVVFSDSLERPYGEGHQSELCALLAAASYEQVLCRDLDMGDVREAAGGKAVRLLVFGQRRPGDARAGAPKKHQSRGA